MLCSLEVLQQQPGPLAVALPLDVALRVCVCGGGGCRGQQGVSLYTITVTLICSNTDYIHIDYIHRLYTHRLYPHTITPTCSNTDARVRARTHTGSTRWSDKHHPRARETEFGTHTVSGYMYCHYISTTVNHSHAQETEFDANAFLATFDPLDY